MTPDLPNRWKAGAEADASLRPVTWKDKAAASAASMAAVRYQLRRLADGREPAPRVRPAFAFIVEQLSTQRALRRYRRWLNSRKATVAEQVPTAADR